MLLSEGMVISETTLLNRKSSRKQVTMPAYAVSALKSGEIKQMTKGIVAYECLMLANEVYEDSLQDIRTRVIDELEEGVRGLSVQETLKKIISSRVPVAKEDLRMDSEYDDPDADISHVNLHLPTTLVEQLPMERYVGEHVTEAVVYTVASPWESRVELVRDLFDILALSRGEEPVDPSGFVIEVTTGRSNRFASEVLEPLHEAIMGNEPFQPLDRDGKRMDVGDSVDRPTVESVDEVPVWASVYSWDEVGLSPVDELSVEKAKELVAGAKNTRRQRVPIVFSRMNSVGAFEDTDDVTQSDVETNVHLLFKHNDTVNTPEDATLERYVEETIELMKASPDWVRSPILEAYEEGVPVPKSLLNVESVKGDNGFEHIEHGVKEEYDVFMFQDSAIVEHQQAVLEGLIDWATKKRDSVEVPELSSGINPANAQQKIVSYGKQIDEAEELSEWIDGRYSASE